MAEIHALILTDVVDSTRLTEQIGDEAAGAMWAAHDRAARDLLPLWRGREIDKTDGMLLLFSGIADAVGYAMAYHRALAQRQLPIKARAGIHVGPVILRANPPDDVLRGAKPLEVSGRAVPLVARIMSVAMGGQTLLSEDARRALGPAPQRIQSHGHWRLQGIAEPIELFEIGEGSAPFTAPPDASKACRVARRGDLWQPLRNVAHSLPAERDSFVGRRGPLDHLSRQFEHGARLVSVVGIGGTGKTRLVTRFGWATLGQYEGGTWFCDLSQARDPDGIRLAVAQGLGVSLGGDDSARQLEQAIAGRGPCLVVLDNFEQVACHAESTLGQWLDRAPQARFVVTSREVLGIVGEQTLALAPLSNEDGVALFVRRAQAAAQDPSSDPADLDAIDALVRVLDGLPLAIELAAARARVMSPRALLGRMNDRFELLSTRSGRIGRQATLRAAFDWSWDLLSEAERAALACLSVFEGGFTVDTAAAIVQGGVERARSGDIDTLQGLVDKSFVRQVGDDRFDLLESVRVYAAQHLRTAGRFAGSGPAFESAVQARHWEYFSSIDERSAVAHRCVEVHNLITACRRAAAAAQGVAAAGCLANAWAALRLTGPYQTAFELAQAVAAVPSLPSREQAWVHWVSGSALDMLGDVEAARAHFEQGLACAAQAGDRASQARLLLASGSRQTLDGDLDMAWQNLEQARRLSVDLLDPSLQALSLNALGRLMDHQARVGDARQHYEAALAVARTLGDKRLEGGLLGNLGGLFHDIGEVELAQHHYQQALALARDVGDRRWEGNAHCNLGLLYQEQRMADRARTEFDAALELARSTGHVRLAYTVQCNMGILLTSEGRAVEGARQLEQAIAAATASSDRRAEGQFRGHLALALARQARMDEARASLATGEQLLLAMSDQLSHALLLCDRVEVEWLAGQGSAALQAFDSARQRALALRCGDDSDLARRLKDLTGLMAGARQPASTHEGASVNR